MAKNGLSLQFTDGFSIKELVSNIEQSSWTLKAYFSELIFFL